MADRMLTVEQILTILRETPPRLTVLTAGLNSAQLHVAPAEGQWSANEVLAHLRACADVWGGCMVRMLAEDHPTIRAVNPRTWIEQTDYRKQPFRPSLQALAAQRTLLLSILEPLTPDTWARQATITGAGRPLTRTVQAYAQWLATHERPHVKQIARIVEALRAEP